MHKHDISTSYRYQETHDRRDVFELVEHFINDGRLEPNIRGRQDGGARKEEGGPHRPSEVSTATRAHSSRRGTGRLPKPSLSPSQQARNLSNDQYCRTFAAADELCACLPDLRLEESVGRKVCS